MSETKYHSAFALIGTTELPEYEGIGVHLRHQKSGAEVFHVHNSDDENAFAFAFPSYPEDSTGVAHILEHTVLSGSRKYPLKDPFLQLMKGSVNTFLNAMTFPDRTVYPAASPVAADLFNLMDVYGDAVFFPLLKPELFRQEGHRLMFDADGSLSISGVVYNEMKGNYSSHDSIVGELCYQSLFPDTVYQYDSGGDPQVIPDLSYDQFVAFHRRFYHPANAKIFLYGSIETNEYLRRLDERFLSHFASGDRLPIVSLQPRWETPRYVEGTYPIDGDDLAERSSVTINWLLPPVTQIDTLLELSVLSEILLGHSGSPLSRTLIDSGLGQDLSPILGIETDLREGVFSVGLRGTEPDRRAAIEELVDSTLRSLARDGLDPDAVEAALRRVEFRERELKSGPTGLRAMRRAIRHWIYGENPAEPLALSAAIDRLRARRESTPRLFEEVIERYFVDNPHRTTVTVRPDPEHAGREEAQIRARLGELAVSLSQADRDRIAQENEDLDRLQNSPDDPEALAAIPSLSPDDIPPDVHHIDYERTAHAAAGALYRHDFFTNGIAYVDLAFEFDHLNEDEELLLNLLGAAFTEVGLPDTPWDTLQGEIGLKTGGIGAYVLNRTRFGDLSKIRRFFVVRLRVLERAWREGADLVERVLTALSYGDPRRLTQVIDELRQEMLSALIPHGHFFSGLRAGLGLNQLPVLEEKINGVSQHQKLTQIASDDPAAVGSQLQRLVRRLLDPSRLAVNLCAQGTVLDEIAVWVDGLTGKLRDLHGSSAGLVQESPALSAERPRVEYLLTSAGVSYVSQAIPGASFGEDGYAAQDLLAHLLRTGALWEKIRMEGGAYGAFASSRSTESYFSFGSYRDPQTVATLAAFRGALSDVAAHGVGENDLNQAKVALLGRELKPLKPREAAHIDFRRHLYDIDDALRRKIREDLRAVTGTSVKAAASRLIDGMDGGYVCILGGSAGLEEIRGAHEVSVLELGV